MSQEEQVESKFQGIALPTDRVRLNTWIKRGVFDEVADIAKSEDMSISDIVRDALKDYVRRYKSRAREARKD